MELKSHSSCSAASISGRESFWIVCVCVHVCVHVCMCGCLFTCSIRLTSSAESEPAEPFLSLFAHLLFQQQLFLVSSACSNASHPCSVYCPCSHPPAGHLSFPSSDLCYISTAHLMRSASCQCLHSSRCLMDRRTLFVPQTCLLH